MTKIHNIVFLRIMSIVILFSTTYLLLSQISNFNVLSFISNSLVVYLFVIFLNTSNNRSTLWLLIPFSIYLVDRFFIYMLFVIEQLRIGADIFNRTPALSILLQINFFRFTMTLTLVFLVIYFITSKQKVWFYKLYYPIVILLIFQIVELVFYFRNETGINASGLLELIMFVPSFLFFPVFMLFVTRLHLFEIYTELGVPNDISTSFNPVNTSQTNHSTPAPKAPINPSQTAPERPYKPKPQTQAAPTKPKVCPVCKTQNTTTFCQNCGQDLR